ncbi:MAG: hypothetical protein MI725_07025 [Pirellulales bacterium]|nr:hypothetical protein [Pirellulales bacterium]
MPNHNSGLSHSDMIYPAVTENSEASHSHALVPAQPAAAPAMPAVGLGFPQGPEIIHGAFNQTWLINCLRRRWVAALMFGMLAALVAALFLMWLFPESSQITALLEVKGSEDINWEGKKEKLQHKELELFQETQKALFKSQFVLKAALHPIAISQLEAVRKEGSNALLWLYEGIKANFKGEILEVRYDGEEDSEEMKKIVNAIISAYIEEVDKTKRIERSEVIDKLKDLYKDLTVDLEEKIERYQKLAKDLEGGDSPIATNILNMLISDVRLIEQQIITAKKELVEIEVQRKLAEQQAQSVSAIEQAVQDELSRDPIMLNYQNTQYALAEQIRSLQSASRGSSAAIKRLQQQQQSLEQEMQEYEYQKRAEIRQQLKSTPNDLLRMVLTEYITRRDQLSRELADLEAKKDDKIAQIQQRGEKSGTLAMLNSEIEQLTEIARTMDYRLRSADVEDETAQENIRVIQSAYAEEKINVYQRYAIVGLGGIGAFCGTCYLIALIEFRRRRLNTPADVDEGLGIRVLGVLPPTASRRASQPASQVAV